MSQRQFTITTLNFAFRVYLFFKACPSLGHRCWSQVLEQSLTPALPHREMEEDENVTGEEKKAGGIGG